MEQVTSLAERNISVYVIVTLVGAVTTLFGVVLWLVRRGSLIQEKRIADRDRHQAEVTELARGTAGIVERNTQGLFVFTKELETLAKRVDELEQRRKALPSKGTG